MGIDLDDDEKNSLQVTPELASFMAEPMSRVEVIRLVQPLRSAILSIFQGTMTSLAMAALQADDPELKEKAKSTFEQLNEVFSEIDVFDLRLGQLLKGDRDWAHHDGDAVSE